MVPLGYTEERNENIDYSTTPILQSWGCFFVLTGSPIQAIPDLTAKRIGYARSSLFYDKFVLLLNDFSIQCELVEFAGYNDLFAAIGDGTIDGGIGDRLNQFGLSQELARVINSPIVFHPFGLFVAVQNGDPRGLLPVIEEYLHFGSEDPESKFNRSINRWLHGSIEGETDTAAAYALLYGALILAFLIYLLTRISHVRKILGMSVIVNQKAARNVLFISVAAAVFLWFTESTVEFIFYNDIGDSFGNIVLGVKHHHLMHRFMYVVSLLAGGMIVSQVLLRLKHEQEEARKVAENLRVTLQSIGDGIITTDINGIITSQNRTATELTGWTEEESRGKLLSKVFQTISNQVGEIPFDPVSSVLADEKIVSRAKHIKLISRTGSEYHITTSAAPIRAKDKTIIGVILVFSDVTDEHKLETQLNQALRMESIGRLAGGVAHDFNNMLNVILGYVDLIKMDIQSEDSQVLLGLDEIQGAAERSAELTQQLLAFTRCQTVKPVILDLNKTTESMLNMLRRLIGEDIDLIWEPADVLKQIRMDPGQINQLLANLVVNSRDAISGAGKIILKSEQVELDSVFCSTQPDAIPGVYVMLSVSDDGAGIDSKTRLQIFEPFFTTKKVGEGTGLGLSTVYGIVKQNKGFINVYSEPGIGTVFRIYLPVISEERIEQQEEEKKVVELSQKSETILLVEDEISILSLAKKMLEKLGYNVFPALSPREAIRLAEEHDGKIDLMITDIVMPEMNGRILVEKLLASYPNLKYIYMSGYTAEIVSHEGILEGDVNFISKPFSLSTLASEVRKVLDQK